ncbi:MAG: hypothetical protein HY319_08205 [Armatimonadetes bacterium]|nr:hypothetical protein [Armatimonadota bacterium]
MGRLRFHVSADGYFELRWRGWAADFARFAFHEDFGRHQTVAAAVAAMVYLALAAWSLGFPGQAL